MCGNTETSEPASDDRSLNYTEAVEDVESKTNDRKEPTLEKTREALNDLGRPDRDYELILIGGTNGKGSTAEMVSTMLRSQGFSVGKFTSPHLETLRERIEINGEIISKEEFLELYRDLEDYDLTFFEFITVAAYLKFSRESVDYAVMEVGMGGRLDATNAGDNTIAAITNVGTDHSKYLGDTKAKIAREKAGTIPENGKLVDHSGREEIREVAEERDAEIVPLENVEKTARSYVYQGKKFELDLKGDFQVENLETALTVMRSVGELPENVGEALREAEIFGRMSKVMKNPETVFDGAHNREALEKTVKEYDKGFICVFSALESKEIGKMIDIIEYRTGKIIATESSFERAESPEKIAEKTSIETEIVSNPVEAVEKAREKSSGEEVVVTGSLYLIGDLKKRLDI